MLGRTVQGSVKITATERELLVRRYGTIASGLRVALNYLIANAPAPAPKHTQPQLGEGFAGLDGYDTPDRAVDAPEQHLHRRGTKLNTFYDQGTQRTEYLCAVPGCTTTLTN